MELVKGTVAKSIAGRDKGKIQVVVSLGKNNVFVCDGRKRKLENPKSKNLKHLQLTKNVLNKDQILSNSAIRKALVQYK